MTQIDVNSGGYQAEYGGAMGGVINSVLKSGSNEFHGSVFTHVVAVLDDRQPQPGRAHGRARWAACASPTTTPALAPRSAAR